MSLSNIIKRIKDEMRNDAGVNGDAQIIEQIVWILFLKVYDAKEAEWEFVQSNYQSIIPDDFRWRNWAHHEKGSASLTGEGLLDFVNNKLFPSLKNLEITSSTSRVQEIVRQTFEDSNNYMKDGVQLRLVIDIIDEINFDDYEEKHAFGEIYETMLKDLQAAGNYGEYYTPRAVTDFIAEIMEPKLGQSIADFACGTGGFLTSTLKILDTQVKSAADKKNYDNAISGVDKMQLPYMLCVTNMLLHDINSPNIIHGNSLDKNVRDYKEDEKFDLILMNPPYGGSEKAIVQKNFPQDLRSSETADLFLSVIMYRLKKNGRAAVVLPDGFLFGTDQAKVAIKKKLLTDFNLHTIIRMPNDIFAPYTNITTNILFFDNDQPTGKTWFYRLDKPEGYKHFSKTKPVLRSHFNVVDEWWKNRTEIEEDGFSKSKAYTFEELEANGFNLDLCGYPHYEEEILPPDELIANYRKRRAEIDTEIDDVLVQIEGLLNNG
jgi:type I restriction enzyme M protein